MGTTGVTATASPLVPEAGSRPSALGLSVKLGAIAVVNLVLTFGFQWVVLTRVGPGSETDALFAAMVVPQLVLAVLSGSLTHVLVPVLATAEGSEWNSAAWMFFQGVLLVFGAAAVLLAASADIWVPWTVPGFHQAQRALAIGLLRVQLVGMVLSAGAAVLWAAAYARHAYARAESSPVIGWAAALLFLAWGLPRWGIAAAAWALVLRQCVQMLSLLPMIGRWQAPDFRTVRAVEARRRLVPLLFGTTYYKTEQLLDRILASMAPAGSLSLLHLGSQLYNASHTVLNSAVAAPAVPRLATASHRGEWAEYRHVVQSRLRWIVAATLLGLLLLALVGQPVLDLLFGHGRFRPDDLRFLWLLLLALGGTLVGGAAGQILSSSFYAMGDTVTPTRIGILSYTLGIPLKIAGFLAGGILGLALATSVYYLVSMAALAIVLRRRVGARAALP